MSEPRVKWKDAKRYFTRNGYELYCNGGDIMIVAPKGSSAHRPVVRIGHKFCNHSGDELSPGHLSLIKRHFGVTRKDIEDV